jgi:hypothetical protein
MIKLGAGQLERFPDLLFDVRGEWGMALMLSIQLLPRSLVDLFT